MYYFKLCFTPAVPNLFISRANIGGKKFLRPNPNGGQASPTQKKLFRAKTVSFKADLLHSTLIFQCLK
jgi:hypothetical protein